MKYFMTTSLKDNRYSIRTFFMILFIFCCSMNSLVFGASSYKMLARKLAQGVKSLKNRKIAILPFPHHDGKISAGSVIISERLTTYMAEFKTIDVIERTLLDKVLSEHRLAKTGIIDQATTKEIGKILGVEAIVTGTLIDLENKKIEVNARMIHTETGKILSTGLITVKRTWTDNASQPQEPAQKSISRTQSHTPDEQFEFIVKLGSDFQGKVTEDGTLYSRSYYGGTTATDFTNTIDADTGISLSGELIGYINDNFGLGFGFTYQMARGVENIEGEFHYIPIYGLCKIRFPQNTVSPYIIGQGGYNFVDADTDYTWNGDIEGGAYAGFGGGIQFKNGFLLELLYSINYGYLEISGPNYYEIYLNYRKLRLAAGFAF